MDRIKTIFHLFFTLCAVTTFYAQTGMQPDEKKNNGFEKVTNLYLAGKLHDTVYMGMVDSLAALSLDKGVYYGVSEMPDNLKQYEKIAWSKKEYRPYRIDYFTILLNNAYLSGKWGASIFYAEKVARQSEKEDMYRPFIEPGVKMYIYSLTNQKDKQIETYQKHKQQIQDLSVKIKKEPEVYYWDGMDALRILSPIINTYFHRKDTLKGEEAYKLASSLIQGIEKDSTTSNSSRQTTKYYTIAFDFFRASGFDRKNDVKAALNKLEALLKKGDIIGDEYAYNLLDWKANYFLEIKQVDSAAFYIGKLEKTVDFSQDQQIRINRYKSQLELLRGNPERSHELLNKALEESFKMQAELSAEMDNLLYAYTEAEHHRLAFEKSETEKKKRNTWIIAISLALAVVITGGIALLRLKDRKLKKTVKDLNETADIQIALMRQFESEVRKEEQERLSQNLHDDLAGILAAVKNNVDLQVTETKEIEQKQKLIQLSEMIKLAFNNVRSKSHELFETAQLPSEEMFYQYIVHLAHIAFPDKHYKLNIQVDDYSLVNTSMEFRSELIRVIQEAFTNIIKHAKATQVDLLIYKESDELFVVIKDNGNGLELSSKQNTLGISNMKKRLKKFNAVFTFHSGITGVEIIISIPENNIKQAS
ncbi:hypothetical protein NU10_13625 [Flavobacterium dauae]|uniref:sensor histidine kinase n=1 Tax=Flavobacterium dauae TaxID=1563479 RepID=UPI00101CE878|nr:ATP-binding protein [Flavobacterium dauae]WLD23728.1 hypothetical protein NU10_13625 [Flavobacterium dauae]